MKWNILDNPNCDIKVKHSLFWVKLKYLQGFL